MQRYMKTRPCFTGDCCDLVFFWYVSGRKGDFDLVFIRFNKNADEFRNTCVCKRTTCEVNIEDKMCVIRHTFC